METTLLRGTVYTQCGRAYLEQQVLELFLYVIRVSAHHFTLFLGSGKGHDM